ncbi:MAG: EMC3/TMCO1 family protein [archaeon]|nr:EMC3/TMCO1 family protein [archaeon]
MNKGMKVMFFVVIISLVMGGMWNRLPFIKDTIHGVLDPTAGRLLNWNIDWGMVIIAAMITLITTLLQKYTTDQNLLREIKKEQKLLQEEINKYKNHPEKLLELQKKQLEFIPKTMDITMRPLIYTVIPIILFFRWFSDYFLLHTGIKIFGFFGWIWAYLIFSIIFSMILRKALKVA